MIEYFHKNLDDQSLTQSLSRVNEILKKYILTISPKNKIQGTIKECQYNGNLQQGIFHFLSSYGSDIVNSGNLKIKDSTGTNIETLKKLFKIDGCYNANLKSKDKACIEFDFIQRKVKLTSYTIRSCSSDNGTPKSWKILGSNDGVKWVVLDQQMNRLELRGQYKQSRFVLSDEPDYYRYIQYAQEQSWGDSSKQYYIDLTFMEFFGYILEP